MVILLGQDGKFAVLLMLQTIKDSLVLQLWRGFEQMIPQRFVLPGLDLTRVLELLLNL